MRAHVIFLKALRDLSGLKRCLIFLGVLLAVPLIASIAISEADPMGVPFAKMTLGMQLQFSVGLFIVLAFLWTAGIPLVLLAGLTCGSAIAKEDEEGTLLLLVSKPVGRLEIVLGKSLAFAVNAALIELAALLLTPVVIHLVAGTDVFVLETMLSLVPWLFLYSLVVAFAFGALSLALSSLMRNRMRTLVVVVALAILIFFGIGTARGLAGGFYERYGLYSVDLNYHLGNAYLVFVERSGVRVMPIFQGIIGQFTGTYDAAELEKIFDRDIGAMPPALEPKGYLPEEVSLALWLVLGLAFFALAALDFERREIQR